MELARDPLPLGPRRRVQMAWTGRMESRGRGSRRFNRRPDGLPWRMRKRHRLRFSAYRHSAFTPPFSFRQHTQGRPSAFPVSRLCMFHTSRPYIKRPIPTADGAPASAIPAPLAARAVAPSATSRSAP